MYSKQELLKYVELLAKGVDPLTGEILESNALLNRPDIIRMFYELKKYLLDDNKSSKKKSDFILTTYDGIIEPQLTITNFVRNINEANCRGNMKKVSSRAVTDWLFKEGYLELTDGNQKIPTEKGESIGISFIKKKNSYGLAYIVVCYDSNAQKFILENLENGNIDLRRRNERNKS